LFFPPCCGEAAVLEEGVSDHRHERMTVKALPGSSLEVIETEFFFQLLVSLLANLSRLDGGRQGVEVHPCAQPITGIRQHAAKAYTGRDGITVIGDAMRDVIETEWPDLAAKLLPPKDVL
jgi:hypothetical protein